jgi:two-component system sensor histidine kinase FlrB
MGELAARVAHQIRTPVSAAMLYAGQLADEELASDTRKAFSNRILERLRDLERMTRDMLQFVRSDSGQRPAETFSLGALLEDLRSSVAASGAPGDRLEQRLGAVGSMPLRGDRQALVGALANLVENAWQSAEAGVCVRIEAAASDTGLIELRIRDDGPGIDADIAEHVFDPFFSGRCGGTGLGLAVARSVLESHGGAIELCDPAAGRGCEFRIRLPAAGGRAMRDDLPAGAGARV